MLIRFLTVAALFLAAGYAVALATSTPPASPVEHRFVSVPPAPSAGEGNVRDLTY